MSEQTPRRLPATALCMRTLAALSTLSLLACDNDTQPSVAVQQSALIEKVYLSDLEPTGTPQNGWGMFERDRSNGEIPSGDGRPLSIAGTSFTKGLGVHANSALLFVVPEGCQQFSAQVGIDDEVGARGSVQFRLGGVYTQPPTADARGGDPAHQFTVPVQPGSTIQLIVTDLEDGNAYDHADWADAHFDCGEADPVEGDDPSTPGYDGEGIFCGYEIATSCGSGPGTDNCDGPEDCADAQVCSRGPSGVGHGSVCHEPYSYSCDVIFPPLCHITADCPQPFDSCSSGGSCRCSSFGAGGSGGSEAGSGGSSEAGSGGSSPGTGGSGGAGGSSGGEAGATTLYLSDFHNAYSVTANGWGPVEFGTSNGEQAAGDGVPIKIAGVSYSKGIGVHAYSKISFTAPGRCHTFQAYVGVDDEKYTFGSVVFEVSKGDNIAYTSPAKHGGETATPVSVAIQPGESISLIVTDAGDGITADHGDWADAAFICDSSTAPPAGASQDDPNTDGDDRAGYIACGTAGACGPSQVCCSGGYPTSSTPDYCAEREVGCPGYPDSGAPRSCDGPEDCTAEEPLCVASGNQTLCKSSYAWGSSGYGSIWLECHSEVENSFACCPAAMFHTSDPTYPQCY